MMQKVKVNFGSDPELFFQRNGQIIGAEKVIGKDGLFVAGHIRPAIVLDGVQVELHPNAEPTTYSHGSNMRAILLRMRDFLKDVDGVSCSFNGVVEVTRDELNSLSPACQELGCAPSKNIYGNKPVTVNGKTYLKRSAGGHIHLDLRYMKNLMDERTRLVPLLDIFVGNTGVLLDRDPGAAERRENYGRAGEYRIPNYGLEYRTLSNFWLRGFPLMDLMFGMTHFTASVLNHTQNVEDIEGELVETVDIEKVVRAINTNDWDLAYENFQDVKPFIEKYSDLEYPLNSKTIGPFEEFAAGVKHNGIEAYFGNDPFAYWQKEGILTSFPTFVCGKVING